MTLTTTKASWQIKGSAILHELVTLMGLSDAERVALKELKGQANTQASKMTEDFYARLFRHDPTAEYLQGASMERLHTMVGEWFTDLFQGVYDEAYVQKRLGIGHIHVRIGLPVRYPLAMLDVVMAHGEVIAKTGSDTELAIGAFRKVLALDVAIFNQAYEDNQLEHLAGLVGGERLARLLLSGKA